MSVTIDVFYYTGPNTRILLPSAEALVARLNSARRLRWARLRSEEQRARELVALRILEIGMQVCGHSSFRLSDIEYPTAAKPFWNKGADFSISHAHTAVACAIGANCRVGLDVEERQLLDPSIVARVISKDAPLNRDLTEHNAVSRWTQVEAVLKGAGLGIAHGQEIEWREDKVVLRGVSWHVYPIDCGPDNVAHVATNKPATINVRQVEQL